MATEAVIDKPRVSRIAYCGRCHECGEELQRLDDGWEWCSGCLEGKRYASHAEYGASDAECPYVEVVYVNRAGKQVRREVKMEEPVT